MDTKMFDEQMQRLQSQNRSSKTRMIIGIVLLAISAVVCFIPIMTMGIWRSNTAAALSIRIPGIISFILSCVGIPLLITGIVGVAKSNRQISRLKTENNRAGQQQQPNQQQYTPYQQPVYNQPAPQPQYQQPEASQNENQQSGNTSSAGGFVDIDWQKYQPLEAGISYDPSRNYQFHRAEGFVGSMPQTFVNRTFPKCPICCSPEPYWTISQHNQMSWKGNLYLFKCSHCDGIISMSMPDVTTLSNGGGGVATNPSVGLTNLMVKAKSGKQAGVVYGVIESVGKSGVNPACEGKEFKLEDFQQMFLRM